MADIQSAVLWWDEWQLRILVLGSLGLQWFLVLVAPMRKYTVPRWFRTCIWLAYISSDALAIYALATLFNRHARGSSPCKYGGVASSLEVLWAPLLLVHLGGREEITAYNIEDNELWTRHTVTLVSQVTVALYAFYKSWPSDSDGRLLLSAILLFINGVINFCEKPWALRSASINRLVAMSSIIKGERRRPKGWECCFSELDDRYKCWKEYTSQKEKPILSDMDKVQMILSDMSLLAVIKEVETQDKQDLKQQGKREPKKSDNQSQDTLGMLDPSKKSDKQRQGILVTLDPSKKPDREMRHWLRKAFELIYTRANVIDTPAYLACNLLMVPALYVAAITLFSMSRKQIYSVTDVKMTYILMCFTAVLDVFGVLISKLVYGLMVKANFPALCETLPGCNLIGSVYRRMKPASGWLLSCATRFGYREDYFSSGRDKLYGRVSDFLVMELISLLGKKDRPDLGKKDGPDLGKKDRPDLGKKDGPDLGKKDRPDLGSYRYVNKDSWALGYKPLGEFLKSDKIGEIRRSLRDLPFDESVLIWHIATDLCFRIKPPYGFRCRQPPHPEVLRELCTEAISNYMAHLLNFWPEMLMTGSRKHLFTHAMSSLKDLLTKFEKKLGRREKNEGGEDSELWNEVMNEGTKKEDNKAKYPIIHDACTLAKELMELPDDEKRWLLMYRVWVGMLCYSASMCRGYLHAKSLGEGGEFLSYVWLVISLKGAKTLADKLQISEEVELAKASQEQPNGPSITQEEATPANVSLKPFPEASIQRKQSGIPLQ